MQYPFEVMMFLSFGTMLCASVLASDRPLVIAHRGASGALPEHTLAAKATAHAMGADYLEQDVVLTKDNVPIVLHDVTLETVTNVMELFLDRARDDGHYYALDFTLDEIRQLRVNERIDRDTHKRVFPGRFPLGTSDFRIPTLAEELELIQGMNASRNMDTGIYPEIKKPEWHRKQGFDPSKVVIDLLAKYGYDNRESKCFLQCFDREETRRMREELKSDLPLIQLLEDRPITELELKAIAEYADGIGPSLMLLWDRESKGSPKPSDLVEECHKLGLQVHPWTIRSDDLPEFAASYEELLGFVFRTNKCDGAFTDFSDTTLRYLEAGE